MMTVKQLREALLNLPDDMNMRVLFNPTSFEITMTGYVYEPHLCVHKLFDQGMRFTYDDNNVKNYDRL